MLFRKKVVKREPEFNPFGNRELPPEPPRIPTGDLPGDDLRVYSGRRRGLEERRGNSPTTRLRNKIRDRLGWN